MSLVVGVVQHPPGDREAIAELIDRVRDAELLVLPEYSNGLPGERVEPLEEWVEFLSAIAEEHGTRVLAGVVEERGGCRYSSVVLVEPGGRWGVIYRKRILFRALGVDESRVLCPGREKPRVVEAGGVRIGVVVCYELRIPEVVREAVLMGADVVVAPSAWYPGPLKEDHLYTLAKARALDNTAWIVVVNQPAPRFTGRSIVVDPWGVARLQLPPGPAYAETLVDAETVRDAREKLPVLRDALEFSGGRL